MPNNQSCSIAISSSSSKINHLDKDAFHTLLLTTHTMLPMKNHMAVDGVVGEGEGEGEGEVMPEVDMETIKNMMGIQTGAEVVGEAEDGDIVVPGMKEAEVEGAEVTRVGAEGRVAGQGVVAIKGIDSGSFLRLAKCLPCPVRRFY